ncbi:MFS general substrate transporter [Tothia fuscella]|uniref:MFS general substrate transporter n=1 Tax=Tothia fuscella TaxID=1048955 RepID=A0A9P4TT85_9PEZI|nr:MFS general substrate transporter [Tothia fuscella]
MRSKTGAFLSSGSRWRSSTAFILITVTMGLFTDLFLWGVIIPILPFLLSDRLHIPPAEVEQNISWLLSSNSLGALLFSPIAGLLANKVRSKQILFLFGLGCLIVATVLLYLGRSMSALLVARAFQGTSGAIVWIVGQTICLETVGSARLGLTMGTIWSIISLGAQIAPVAGGTSYKYFGYAGIFWLSIALLSLDFITRLLILEQKHDKDSKVSDQEQQDSESSPLLTIRGENSPYAISPSSNPILLRMPFLFCLRDPALVTSLFATFVQATIFAAFDATIPVIAANTYNLDSFATGLIFLSLGVPEVMFGPVTGYIVDRIGTRIVAVVSWGLLGLTLIALALQDYQPHQQDDQVWRIAAFASFLTLSGTALTMTVAPTVAEAGIIVESYFKTNKGLFGDSTPYALLYGLNSGMFNAGFSLGPVLVAWLRPLLGYAGVYLLLAVFSFLVSFLSVAYFRIRAQPSS